MSIRLVIPKQPQKLVFKLRESCRQIDNRKRHCIELIICRLRSSIFGVLTRLNTKLFIAMGITCSSAAVAQTTSEWTGDTSINWSDTGNWNTGTVPKNSGDEADFLGVPPIAPKFLPTVDAGAGPNISPYLVGTIKFNPTAPGSYTISSGAGVLNLSNTTGSANIESLAGANTIAATMLLVSNLSVTVSSTAPLTLSGLINNSGSSITTSGSGTTILSNAANAYTGGTTISAGTLQATSNGALGTSGTVTIASGTFQAGGTFSTLTRAFTLGTSATIDTNGHILTIPGVISGAAMTIKATGGSGTLLLQGTNLYTGGTTVTSGTLQISADNNLGPSGTLTLAGGSILKVGGPTFDLGLGSGRQVALTGSATVNPNGNSAQISSDIEGIGSLTVTGGGSLNLTGVNSYQGQTTVDSLTTLQGNTTSLPGNITITGDLIFNQTTEGTYSHILNGAGNLTIQGGGPLTISGSSPSFSGATSVTGSELIMNGSLAGSSLVTIDSTSTLSGSGTIGTTTNSGILLPGTLGEGTLAVNGALTFNPGSFFRDQITPLSSGLVQVSGVATLTNGALIVEPVTGSGFFGLTNTYTILTGSTVIFPFSSVSVTDPNFTVTPIYSAVDVKLLVSVSRPFVDFPCSNANECAVAYNIDALSVEGSLGPSITAVIDSLAGQSDAVVNDALDQMHPAAMSAFAELQAELGGQLLSIFHRGPSLRCACSGSNRMWVEPFGNWLKEKKQGMEIGFNATTRGVAFGYDHQFLDCWTLGFGGAWSATDLKWSLDRGYSYVNGLYGSIYTDLILSNFYIGGSVYVGKDWYNTARHIHFTTIDLQATSHTDGFDMAGQLTAAYFFGTPSCLLYPYATVDYLYLQNASFSESGANSLDLNVDQYTSSTLRAEAGGAWRFIDRNRDDTICISPLISMGYVLELPLHRNRYQSTFFGQNIPFKTQGWDMAWQLLNLRFGLAITYRCFTLDSQYIADVSPDGDSPFFNQRANFRFTLNF